MRHFLLRANRLGGHVHVRFYVGDAQQAANHARANIGTLIMDNEDWLAFQTMLDEGTGRLGSRAASVEIDGR
jgi:hypothetical protein